MINGDRFPKQRVAKGSSFYGVWGEGGMLPREFFEILTP